MWLALVAVLAGLAILTLGGEALVRGAAGLALRFGLTPAVIGLTVVAFGTSSPELAVSIDAARAGLDGIAVGNVVGSNIANVALICGIAALVRPLVVEARLVRVDIPLMLAASVAVAALLLVGGGIGRLAGALLVAALVAWIAWRIVVVRRESDAVRDEFGAGIDTILAFPLGQIALIVLGIGTLALGATLLVNGATVIARGLGLTPAVIGLTVVAVGTSLPELATSVVAARRNQGDIAVGNIVGSNLFNLLAILGLTALVLPLSRAEVTVIDLGVMLATSAALWAILWRGVRVGRVAGALLLASWLVYMGWLLLVQP